jgi:membrane fusion protein (multidrug efflux system)
MLQQRPMQRTVNASGVASGIREAYVVSEAQGTIERVSFSLGQYINRGTPLVELDKQIQETSFEQAQRSAEGAQLNLNAVKTLHEQGSASEAELKNAQSAFTGARFGMEQARKMLDNRRILAPISGFIADKQPPVQQGNLLNPGTMIGRIVDISSLKAIVPVGEMEVGLLRKGAKANIIVPALGDREFSGTISAIAAGADPASGSYPIEVVWNNTPDRAIKAGMSVRVTLQSPQLDSVLSVPLSSIVSQDGKEAVYVEVNGRAALRFVTTGRTEHNEVEIVEGVEPGQRLLVSGISSLGAGDSVVVTLTTPNEAQQ